ncbi:MAG: putative FmdB family regulatory protein [Woeseiaceae bacterium]|jgi:putative FmdB family regulatory protein|tara:strand:- start:2111 stop:2422 length:312 start_codon:yes stop_codon:yes gene_type:complete
MPIYEYECTNCDHNFDELQKMSDAHLVDCPSCNEPKLSRLLSAPSFRLKGGGWYETDFKKDNQRNISKNENDSDKSKKSPSKVDTSKSEQKTIPSKTKTASNT